MSIVDPDVFEQKRAEADFELVIAQLSKRSYPSIKEMYRAFYMAGRGARKLSERIQHEGTTGEKEQQRDLSRR